MQFNRGRSVVLSHGRALAPSSHLRALRHLPALLAIVAAFAASPLCAANELQVRTGLRLWLAAETISTANSTQVNWRNGNACVVRWPDKSGNGFTATQTTAARQPILFGGNGVPNSVLRFDGVDDFMSTTLPQIAGDKSIFIVQRRFGNSWRAELLSTAGNAGHFVGGFTGVESYGRMNIAHDVTQQGQVNNVILKSVIRSGGTVTMHLNDGVATSTVADAAAGNYTVSSLSAPFFGGISEILIYDRAVTETERQSIENYLAERYNLWTNAAPVRNGLRLWLAADAITPSADAGQLRTSAGNSFVTFWPDRAITGAGSQTRRQTLQPRYVTNAINSRPVVRFDGTDDFISTTMPQTAGDKSIFVVQRRTSGNFGMEVASSLPSGLFLGGYGTFEGKARWGIAWDFLVPAAINEFMVKSWVRSNGVETLRFDDLNYTATLPDAAAGNYQLSAESGSFPGDIGEALIYDRALNTTERAAVEDYLFAKFSFPPDNVRGVAPDLAIPPVSTGPPAPGARVRQTQANYLGSNAYHLLYLPTNWQPGQTYPVIVEYSGNAYDWSFHGDRGTGGVEDCALGYGITGGRDFIWISMPPIGGTPFTNQTVWWGDPAATRDYCLRTVREVCENFGGDSSRVILAGFSRGAIACHYIGLGDDTIADTWLGFIPHSHYDGSEFWPDYPEADEPSALIRLARLRGRREFITTETTYTSPEPWLRSKLTDVSNFTFRTLPFVNHNNVWCLRPIQLRRHARTWLQDLVATRAGTFAISGRVTTLNGAPIAGARVESGFTHFTTTDANGDYSLAGLVNSARTVTVTATGFTFAPASVTVAGANVPGINFTAQ